jgi:hypothetical protein
MKQPFIGSESGNLHVKSMLLGSLLGAVVMLLLTIPFFSTDSGPCWLHVKNTGTNIVALHSSGGRLPLGVKKHFGFLPFPHRKQYWGVELSPGQSQSMPYGAGGTISVLDMSRAIAPWYPVWTGNARTLVAELNADDFANISFRVTSQSQ